MICHFPAQWNISAYGSNHPFCKHIVDWNQTTQMVQEMSVFWWLKVLKLQLQVLFFFSFFISVFLFSFFFFARFYCSFTVYNFIPWYKGNLFYYFSPFSLLFVWISSDCNLKSLPYISWAESLRYVQFQVIRHARPVLHGGSTGGNSSQVQLGRSFLSSTACPASSSLFQTEDAMFSSLPGSPLIRSFLNTLLSKWPCLF